MVAALILAAGRSSRMGRPKALLRHVPSGRTFVEHLVSSARGGGVNRIYVVGRTDNADLRHIVERAGAVFVPNPDAEEGQLSSLLRGLDAAASPELEGILVMPVDVALVSSSVVRRLLDAAEDGGAAILRATHDGRHGHPVLFRKVVFDELRTADPALGARAVVHADPARVQDVEVGDPGVTFDIDTPPDYERAFGRSIPEGS